jgi:hypothetical protein
MYDNLQYILQESSGTKMSLRCLLNALLFIVMFTPVFAHAQQAGNYDEVPVALNVPRIGNTEIYALISEEEIYLPVKELFDFLKIKNTPSSNFDSISGSIINPKDYFLFDRTTNAITYENKVTALKPGELISAENGLYLKVFYFGKIFGLDCSFNFRSLSVTLAVKTELPVIREMQQELMRKNLNQLKAEKKADTTIRRIFSFFHLGMADWIVAASQQNNGFNYTRASLTLGGLVLGGEANIYGNYNSDRLFDPRQQYFRWRYANNDLSAIKQITIGRISLPTVATLRGPVTGIQVSNTPTTYRRSFGTYTISNTTQPGWTVELYVNNILINYTKADASGFFTFEVPMIYGNSIVKLRFYGPWGEETTQEQMISVPFNFLPRHQFEYNIAVGSIGDESKSRLSRANFNYGLNRHLTVGGGIESISPVSFKKPYPFVNASLRLANNLIFSGEHVEGIRSKGILNYKTASNLQLEINYVKYREGQSAVLTHYIEDKSASLSFPYRSKRFNSFTRFTYHRYRHAKAVSNNAELLISASAHRINSNLTTNVIFSDPALIYAYSNLSLTFPLPKNIRFTPQLKYGYREKEITRVKIEIEKTIFNNGVINLTYENDEKLQSDCFSMGLRINFSAMSTFFSASHSKNSSTFTQTIGGSLIYDDKTSYANFNKNFSVGKGAISIIAFLDLNGNSRRDAKEPVVPGLKFRINGGRTIQDEDKKISRVMELEAYRSYLLELDASSFDNIAWQIKNKTINVEVEPNRVKPIEVPVKVVSEASGYVYLKTNKAMKGLGRIIVNFYTGDTVIGKTLTEPDGYFSYLGFTPGSYIAKLDSIQLQALKLVAAPAMLSFTIGSSEEGVIADGFQFTVQSLQTENGDDGKQIQLHSQDSSVSEVSQYSSKPDQGQPEEGVITRAPQNPAYKNHPIIDSSNRKLIRNSKKPNYSSSQENKETTTIKNDDFQKSRKDNISKPSIPGKKLPIHPRQGVTKKQTVRSKKSGQINKKSSPAIEREREELIQRMQKLLKEKKPQKPEQG